MELARIQEFFACSHFAIAGVSRSGNKMGNAIFKELKKQAYSIVPVHPQLSELAGEKVYPSINELPDSIEALIIATKPETTKKLLHEAVDKGIKHIFLQQGSENKECIQYARDSGVNLIYKRCVFMFAHPQGLHKFHRSLSKLFHSYPN